VPILPESYKYWFTNTFATFNQYVENGRTSFCASIHKNLVGFIFTTLKEIFHIFVSKSYKHEPGHGIWSTIAHLHSDLLLGERAIAGRRPGQLTDERDLFCRHPRVRHILAFGQPKALFALLQLNLGLVGLLAFTAALRHVALLDLQSLFLCICGLFLLLLFRQELV
jgi:hypothetical protein